MGLDRLLRPSSVAVVGGAEAARVVEQLDRWGYGGDVWPIHPTRPDIGGRECVPSPDDLPGPPDAAFVAVPRDATPDVIAALARIGARSAVVYTSGFAESGDHALQAKLADAAGAMPLLGPNCYGYVNALDRTAVWPDVHGLQPRDRGVAIITQSGNIGINLTMARRGLDIGMVITAGNQAVLDLAALMDGLLDDHRITALGVQLESITDAQAFAAVARRAAGSGVPIVALKMGTSARGALVTSSHTGALAGDDEAYGAFFRRYGIARVRTIPEFLETLKLAPLVAPSPRVLSLSASGGEASHVADLAHEAGVDLPVFEPEQAAAIGATVGPLVAVSNPMDYHTFSWGDGDRLRATFGAAVADRFDVAMLVLDFPAGPIPEAWWTACEAFAEACRNATGLVVSSLPETMPETAQARIRSMGLVPMIGIAETVAALGACGPELVGADMAAHRPPPVFPEQPSVLDEAHGKALLASAGVAVPHGTVTSNPIPSPVPYPVTIKVLGIEHKADAGAVAVGVRDEAELRHVLAGMPPGAGYLLEETVTGGSVELLISLRADRLGWLLTLGAGGGLVELLDDRVHLLVPSDAGAVRRALEGLRVCRAARAAGRELALDAAVDAVMGLQTLCEDPRVVEAEINPLIVTAGRAVAVDALVAVA